MIVYGDRQRTESPTRVLADLARDGAALADAAVRAEDRSATAIRLLIRAGELAQGLLDAAGAARGCDDWEELDACCAVLTLEAARLAMDDGQSPATLEPMRSALDHLSRLTLPAEVTIKVPEGYAYYALDPALYARAARAFRATCAGPLMVLGVRSIGTSLAAVVSVAAGAAVLPATVRPVGHPFRRTLRVGPRLRARLLSQPGSTRFALVDEGPGLSGSSLGAVADWLEDHGVRSEQIHFFPGHSGDLGPEASPRHRDRWRRSPRHVVDFETLLRDRSPGASWFEDDASAAQTPLEDIGGGAWRVRHFPAESDWPPSNRSQERRKYLYQHEGRTWMAKFAGLGTYGDRALARARRLERAGWIAPVRGLRRGFLVAQWLETARPLEVAKPHDRASLRDDVAAYLASRAREFPDAAGATGATPAQLLEMARVNTLEWFGAERAEVLERWRAHLPALSDRVRRVLTDNKMHAWEWLALPDGRWIKADALDHAEAHDWVGAQDLAWDIAGASVELDLDATELDDLQARLARDTPFRPESLVLSFLRECYLAFQMGYHVMASRAHARSDPAEAARLRRAAEDYAQRLGRLLDSTSRT